MLASHGHMFGYHGHVVFSPDTGVHTRILIVVGPHLESCHPPDSRHGIGRGFGTSSASFQSTPPAKARARGVAALGQATARHGRNWPQPSHRAKFGFPACHSVSGLARVTLRRQFYAEHPHKLSVFGLTTKNGQWLETVPSCLSSCAGSSR